MEWYEILIIALSGLTILIVLQITYKIIRFKNVINKLKLLISESKSDIDITTFKQSNNHHIEFTDTKKYIIKIIDMNPFYEVIITKSDKVVINDDIRNWRRSTKPHFVPGMEDFISLNKTDKNIVKIVLIYPGCHNITKYINESDAHVVEKFQRVDGIYFIRYGELKEFLAKQ